MPEEPTGAALLLRSEQPRAVCDPAAVRPPHSWDASWQMRLLCLTQLGGGLGGIFFFFSLLLLFFDCLQRWKVEEQMQRRGETLQKTLESPKTQKGRGRQSRGRGCGEEGDPVNLPT